MTQGPDTNLQLLIEARDEFFSSVSHSDLQLFSKCANYQAFLADIEKLGILANEKRHGKKLLAKINKLGRGLENYFSTIEILISSHPEFAAIGWGVFRLILQLASNFTTFFEKLANVIERIGDQLPQYKDITKIFDVELPERLKYSISQIYRDLFKFFQGVIKVFTKENGKIKRTPELIGSLFWKPFDQRFNDLLAQLKYHRELLDDELVIQQCRQILKSEKANSKEYGSAAEERRKAAEERQKAAEERRKAAEAREKAEKNHDLASGIKQSQKQEKHERLVEQMKAWISPPEFLQEYEQAQSLMEENTATWLFEDPKFTQWKRLKETSAPLNAGRHLGPNVLWVKGNPGYGKTVLASSTISELRSMETSGTDGGAPATVYFFFFTQTSPNKASLSNAFRAILAQILHQFRKDEAFIDKVSFAMDQTTGGQSVASQSELTELIELSFASIPNIHVVFDGIDECEDSNNFVKAMKNFYSQSNTKFLFFSRPNVAGLRRSLTERNSIVLNRKSNQSDINTYLIRKLQALFDDELLPPYVDVQSFAERLSKGADGMFLWARLMISYLNSPALTPTQRIRIIQEVNLPEGLDQMYARILQAICRADSAQKNLAKQVFTWLAYSKRTLSVEELQAAVFTDVEPEASNHKELSHAIIMSCGGLVEKQERHKRDSTSLDSRVESQEAIWDEQNPQHSFKFIHFSVLEFVWEYTANISTQPEFIHQLMHTRQDAHLEILKRCLSYLVYQSPIQPISTLSGSFFIHAQTFPLAYYASRTWMQHLFEILPSIPNGDANASKEKSSNAQRKVLISCLENFLGNKKAIMAWLEVFYFFPKAPKQEYEKLSHWCSRFRNCMSYATDSTSGKTCLETMDAFIDILKKVDHEWYDVLVDKPSEIWNQVSDWISAKFFDKSNQSTLVTSLAPKLEDAEAAQLSESPFVSISETRSTGFQTAVLSVFTSRRFDIVRRNIISLDSHFALRELCSGWIARYEIWSVVDNNPSRIHGISIDLDEKEIWMQMQQSLRQDISNMTTDFSQTWKIQFPVGIGDNLYSFAVLRTVFTFFVDTNKAIIETVVLPMDTFSLYQPYWRENNTNFAADSYFNSGNILPSDFQLGVHQVYEYSISIGPRNEFVVVRELGSVHVFKLHNVAGKCFADLQSQLEFYHKSTTTGLNFHPFLPLIALNSSKERELDGGYRGILIWNFLDDCQQPTFLSGVGKSTFSECGKHFIISKDFTRPVIIPLENLYVYQTAIKHIETIPIAQTQTSHQSMAYPSVPSQKVVMRANYDTVSVNSKSNLAEFQRVEHATGDSSGGVYFRKYGTTSSNAIDSVQLTVLPKLRNIENSNIVIRMPGNEGDSLKIFLNHNPSIWKGLEDFSAESPPIVIQRDPRSIIEAHTANSKRRKLSRAGGMDVGGAMLIESSMFGNKEMLDGAAVTNPEMKNSDHTGIGLHSTGKRKFKED